MGTAEQEAGQGERLTERMTAAADRLESHLRLGLWQACAEDAGSPDRGRLQGAEGIAAILEELRVVSEQLREENQALAATSRQYEELFQFAPEASVRTDPGGIIQEANRAAARLFDVRQDNLVGKPLALFIAEGERQRFLQRLTSLRKEGEREKWSTGLAPSREQWRANGADGGPGRDVMISATPDRKSTRLNSSHYS